MLAGKSKYGVVYVNFYSVRKFAFQDYPGMHPHVAFSGLQPSIPKDSRPLIFTNRRVVFGSKTTKSLIK